MAGEKFYLRFTDEPNAENLPMDSEFNGWDKSQLTLKQRDGSFGRDESFNDSEAEYVPGRGHHLKKLLQKFDEKGFGMKVKQGVIAGDRTIEFDIDGRGAKTDQFENFRAALIQGGALQKLKDRMETKINLFSNVTLDGDPITPLQTENILYYAYPTVDTSVWEQSEPLVKTAGGSLYTSFFQAIQQSGIEDTLTPFEFYTGIGGNIVTAINTFKYLRAVDTLKDIKVSVDLDVEFIYRSVNSNGQARISLQYAIFDDPYTSAQAGSVYGQAYTKTIQGASPQDFQLPLNITFNIPDIGRNKYLSVFWQYDWEIENVPTDGSSDSDIFNPNPADGRPSTGTQWLFNSSKMTITATRLSYNTVVPMIRLYDAMKYWVKSACGLDIDAPRFGPGGEFYPIRLSNGNLFRLKKNEPFYITGKMIMDSIWPQFKADFEQNWSDESIFFGLFADYYANVEIAFFNSMQFSGFTSGMNPRFMCNDVKIKFSKYESQRENTATNTVDEVHGEYEGFFKNDTKNTYEQTIEWAMSARYLERNRRAAIEEASSTATNDDNTLFAIDVNDNVFSNTNNITFNETSFLQHNFVASTNYLYLRNDGSFSWSALGIVTGTLFVITTTPSQPNQGIYTVTGVNDTQLTLVPQSANPIESNNGERNTRYTYFIEPGTITGETWRDEGLTVSGIANSDRYPNLRYSLGQCIDKYHKTYLATMLYYHPNEYLRTTFYKNNPNAVINGLREGGLPRNGYPEGAFDLGLPILTPVLYENLTFVGNDVTLATWDALVEKIRSIRGFIRFIDNRGVVRKVYVKLAPYSVKDEAIVIKEAEEKFEPYVINVFREDETYININNGEYRVTQLKYEPGLDFRIMDRENQLLYNPIWWNRIYVNGQKPSSQTELDQWLSSL